MAELRKRAAPHRVVESRVALGGGTTPTETIPSLAIEVAGDASENYARFLANDPPIVGRIQNDRFTLETRTLLDQDWPAVAQALARRTASSESARATR